jgi:hypothetical protein
VVWTADVQMMISVCSHKMLVTVGTLLVCPLMCIIVLIGVTLRGVTASLNRGDNF